MKKLLSGFYPFYYIKFSISLPLLVFEPVAFAPVGDVVHKYRAQSGRIKSHQHEHQHRRRIKRHQVIPWCLRLDLVILLGTLAPVGFYCRRLASRPTAI